MKLLGCFYNNCQSKDWKGEYSGVTAVQ